MPPPEPLVLNAACVLRPCRFQLSPNYRRTRDEILGILKTLRRLELEVSSLRKPHKGKIKVPKPRKRDDEDLNERPTPVRDIAFGSCQPRFPKDSRGGKKPSHPTPRQVNGSSTAQQQFAQVPTPPQPPRRKSVRITADFVSKDHEEYKETPSDAELLSAFGVNLKQIDKILGQDPGAGIDETERSKILKGDKHKSSTKKPSLVKRALKRDEIRRRMDSIREGDESPGNLQNLKSDSGNLSRMQYLNKDLIKNPAPNAYYVEQWPFSVRMNVVPFNAGSQAGKELISLGSPCVYDVQKAEAVGEPMKRTKTWGGPQTIELPTIVRCSQEPYDWCLDCDMMLEADYYFSKEFGSLCHDCFIQELHSMLKFNRLQLETFKPARHCREYHYHDGRNNMINRGNIKDVKDMITKEAYFARYPDGMILQRRPLSHPESLKWFQKTRTPPVPLVPQKPQDYEAPRTRPTRGAGGFSPEINRVRLQFAWLEKSVKEDYIKPWMEKYKTDLKPLPEEKAPECAIMASTPANVKDITANRLDRYGSIAHLYRACLEDFGFPGDFLVVDEETEEYILCPKGRRSSSLDVESRKVPFLDTSRKPTRREIFRQVLRDRRAALRRKAMNFRRKFYYAPEEPSNDLEEILKLDKMKPCLPNVAIDLTSEREVIPVLRYNIPPSYFLVRE